MHYDLGSKYVRDQYITRQEFLSANYEPNEIYVQTTHKQRTIDSANAQLDGIFNRTLTFPKVDELFVFDSIAEEIDYSIHVDEDNCPRLGQVDSDVLRSEGNIVT